MILLIFNTIEEFNMKFTYKQLVSTKPIDPSEVNFDELERILDVKLDDSSRDAIIKSDSLRKYLAWKKERSKFF
uniref:Uncharacterized protein n=1 Tax=Leptospira ellisii TaxID=2023197 RepID=A0A2N0B2Q1_9LEPT|nr:hypothetical protein CH379_22290 [Leptospira ellisii]